ncbi:hypothetical protein B0H12DRAFT_1070018, partial [Mycena haematopus]
MYKEISDGSIAAHPHFHVVPTSSSFAPDSMPTARTPSHIENSLRRRMAACLPLLANDFALEPPSRTCSVQMRIRISPRVRLVSRSLCLPFTFAFGACGRDVARDAPREAHAKGLSDYKRSCHIARISITANLANHASWQHSSLFSAPRIMNFSSRVPASLPTALSVYGVIHPEKLCPTRRRLLWLLAPPATTRYLFRVTDEYASLEGWKFWSSLASGIQIYSPGLSPHKHSFPLIPTCRLRFCS